MCHKYMAACVMLGYFPTAPAHVVNKAISYCYYMLMYSLDGERRMQGKVSPSTLVYCPIENLLVSSGVSLVSISVSSSPLLPRSYNTKSPMLFLEMPFKMCIPSLNISESGTYKLREEQCKSNVKRTTCEVRTCE